MRKNFQRIQLLKNGFTLIELVVVIAILSIIISAVVALINPPMQLKKARDSERKSDLRQIQSAVEMYRADLGSYPIKTASPYRLNSTACPTSSGLTSGSTTFIRQVPCDSKGTGYYNTGNYYYYSNGSTYTLAACLENSNDSEGTSTAPSPSGGTCSSNKYYTVNNP